MSQLASFVDCCTALCHRLVRVAKTKQANSESCAGPDSWVDSGLMDKRGVRGRIIEREGLFKMAPG